ncbi:MAG: pilus assembly protein [Proteobacteria bacterium]|nr:pilus assembly protein [Pseudomonadota bacterium]
MKIRRFIRQQEGATIIEFAVVAPVLFLMLAGIIELGLILFTTSALEGATNVGARIGKTGFTSGGLSREDYIRSEIVRLTGGFLNTSQLNISILSYSSFSNIGQPEPCLSPTTPPCPGVSGVNFVDINGNNQWDADQGSASAGGSGSVVLYRVTYPWRLFTPIMASILGSGGIYTITATSAVRNEQLQ